MTNLRMEPVGEDGVGMRHPTLAQRDVSHAALLLATKLEQGPLFAEHHDSKKLLNRHHTHHTRNGGEINWEGGVARGGTRHQLHPAAKLRPATGCERTEGSAPHRRLFSIDLEKSHDGASVGPKMTIIRKNNNKKRK